MILQFLFSLLAIFGILFLIMMVFVINHICKVRSSHVQHRDTKQTLELPPMGKDFETKEETIQDKNILVDVSI